MTHPQLIPIYEGLQVNYLRTSPNLTVMNVGRFKEDGEYHIIGYFPSGMKGIFPEDDVDLGTIRLPDGKTSLSELARDDIFEFHRERSQFPDAQELQVPVRFVRFN
jgi:hypothetical protein